MDPTSAAITLFNNPRLMTTTNKKAADEFRRQVCIGNVHEVVIEEQVQQYFESYAGAGKINFDSSNLTFKLQLSESSSTNFERGKLHRWIRMIWGIKCGIVRSFFEIAPAWVRHFS